MKVSEIMTADFVRVDAEASLDEAMELMECEDVRHLPVMSAGRLVGVLSERDMLEATGWLPRRMRDVLEAPTGAVSDFMHAPVVTASPTATLVTASMRMLEWGVGCLPILDDAELVGMLTEVDLLDAYARACRSDLLAVDSDPNVALLMTVDVRCAEPDTPADEALEFCRANDIRHLPIQKDGELVGIVSDRDLRLSAGRGQLEGTPIHRLLRTPLYTTEAGTRLSLAARTMVEHRIGALPVVDDGTLIGILSTRDVLEHCMRALAEAARGT